jgi:hypothetical protein
MVSTVPITKNTFANTVKDGSMIKQILCFTIHTPLKKWFLALYLYFVLWPGCSVREISLEVAVPYPRCYGFIRTVMEKLSSSSLLSTTKLDGPTATITAVAVESDEFYIKAGLKGRSYHDEIVKSAKRQPRKRGLKPWRGRQRYV